MKTKRPPIVVVSTRKPLKPSDYWGTPQWIIDALGPFDLDVCATPENAKAPKFYTEADNGLRRAWPGRVWCNPPFSQMFEWAGAAAWKYLPSWPKFESIHFMCRCDFSTKWWKLLATLNHDLIFPTCRVQFVPPDGVKVSSNPMQMMIVHLHSGMSGKHSFLEKP